MAPRTSAPFSGETAVVTGASRGIGAAIAVALAAEGLRLVLVARSAGPLGALAEALRARGAMVDVVVLDLTDPAAPETLRTHVERSGGPPFALVNNAGTAVARRLDRLPLDALERQVAVNLLAPVRLTRTFLPGMLARGRGRFVHIGSGAADFPAPRLLVYSMTKSALRAFSYGLDLEVRRRGVRSTVLEPIFVRTELGRQEGEGEAPLERLKREHPRLVLEPEAVARAVVRSLYRPRRRVSVPVAWGAGRLVGLASGPLARRPITLPPPRQDGEGRSWTPIG